MVSGRFDELALIAVQFCCSLVLNLEYFLQSVEFSRSLQIYTQYTVYYALFLNMVINRVMTEIMYDPKLYN